MHWLKSKSIIHAVLPNKISPLCLKILETDNIVSFLLVFMFPCKFFYDRYHFWGPSMPLPTLLRESASRPVLNDSPESCESCYTAVESFTVINVETQENLAFLFFFFYLHSRHSKTHKLS